MSRGWALLYYVLVRLYTEVRKNLFNKLHVLHTRMYHVLNCEDDHRRSQPNNKPSSFCSRAAPHRTFGTLYVFVE